MEEGKMKEMKQLQDNFHDLEERSKEERKKLISKYVEEIRKEKANFESERIKKQKEFEEELKFNRQQLLVMEAHIEKVLHRAELYISKSQLQVLCLKRKEAISL